jgi:hypothetical protein
MAAMQSEKIISLVVTWPALSLLIFVEPVIPYLLKGHATAIKVKPSPQA